MFTRYHYVTLWHQKSLADSCAVPFAVVVEAAHHGRKRRVYAIGKHLPGDESSVSGQILQNFPNLLFERLEKAAETLGKDERLVDVLRSELVWNVYAKEPRSLWAARSLPAVAHALFLKEVEPDAACVAPPEKPTRTTVRTLFELTLPSQPPSLSSAV